MNKRQLKEWVGGRDHEMLESITQRIVHDLNNLTTAALGFADLAMTAGAADTLSREESLRSISHACDQSAGLTRALMLVTGGVDDVVDRYTVTECLRSILPIMRRILPDVDVPDDIGTRLSSPEVPGSPRQLQVALISVAMYVRRATLARCPVTLNITRSATRLIMSFKIEERPEPTRANAYSELEMANTLLLEEGAELDLHHEGSMETLAISLNIESWDETGIDSDRDIYSDLPGDASIVVVEPQQHVRDIIKAELYAAGYRAECVARLDPTEPHDVATLATASLLVAASEVNTKPAVLKSWIRKLRKLHPRLPMILIIGADMETEGLGQVAILRKPFRLPELTRLIGVILCESTSD